MEIEYFNCEKELRNKTEEVEKLKVELKDIKEILKLKDKLKDTGLEEPFMGNESKSRGYQEKGFSSKKLNRQKDIRERFNCEECDFHFESKMHLDMHISRNHSVKDKKEQYNCTKCAFIGTTKIQLNNHTKLKHLSKDLKDKEEQYNCTKCAYQGTTKIELNKHLDLKHSVKGFETEDVFRCKNCGEQFSGKWNLMNHRKIKHSSTVAQCRNNSAGNCSFSSKMCWWNHDDIQNGDPGSIQCFVCDESFESKKGMMIHRKAYHRSFVRTCTNFLQNKCRFESSSCWFLHEEEMVVEENEGNNEEDDGNNLDKDNDETESVFQQVFRNKEPPIRKQKKQKID